MSANTIIGAPFDARRAAGSLLLEQPEPALLKDGEPGPRLFKIRAADSSGQRSSASILIKRMYAWRGYQSAALPRAQTANRITLTASDHDVTIGTITIGLDGPEGLHAEDTFPEEIRENREAGLKLCEFTKLAMDPTSGTKRVLASLFHVAYILAHRIRGYDRLLIEVNPRHVAYYKRMLGCQVYGAERNNHRVDAPAVLLALDFSHTMAQINQFGGRPELASTERSLYPFAFSLTEEAGIISRLERSIWSSPATV